MAGLELVLLLLAVSVALRIVAERLSLPYASLLVVGGLVVAFIPGLPRVQLDPDVLFLMFVPPLLYWGAVALPLRDLRRAMGPITRLAVLLVLVSTVAVAVVARSLDPAFTWAAAFTLGAIVSPPDPVAVLSVMRSLRAPRVIENILEGEGLLNDATALVVYRVAVAAAVTGSFSPSKAALQFVVGAAGGVAVGVAAALLLLQVFEFTRSVPVAENTVSLLAPYAAYLPAQLFGASGVLAVVAAAMTIARAAPRGASPHARLQNAAIWTVVTFLLESLVFILVGLELPVVLRALESYSLGTLLRETAVVSACVILVRIAWVLLSAYAAATIGRWLRRNAEPPPPFRWILFVAWAGVRGGDSLVIALALPLTAAGKVPFPARDLIVFITFGVIFVTLVLQGPTLAPVAGWLGLRGNRGEEGKMEEAHARLSAAEAGLRTLASSAVATSPHPEVIRYLRRRQTQRARRWAAREATHAHWPEHKAHTHSVAAASHQAGGLDERRAVEYRRIRAAMIQEERESLFRMRDAGEIGDDVLRAVLRDLDLESMLLETQEPVIEPVTEVASGLEPEGEGS